MNTNQPTQNFQYLTGPATIITNHATPLQTVLVGAARPVNAKGFPAMRAPNAQNPVGNQTAMIRGTRNATI